MSDIAHGKVTISETGEFTCICGNFPESEGAFACDAAGNEVDPSPANWPVPFWKCARCGVMFHGKTGEILPHVSPANTAKSS